MLPGKTYTPADILPIMRRRIWFVILPMLFGLYAALVYSSMRRDEYQSEMLIQVVPQRVPDEYVRSTVTMRTEDRLNALTQEILSRTALEKLIVSMNLYPEERTRMEMQDIVAQMRDHKIKIENVLSASIKEVDAFYVRFTHPDPVIAKDVTDQLGALYVNLNARDRENLAQRTNEFLESQLAETRQKLEAQDAKLKRFREDNAGRLPTQVSFNMQAIQTTQSAIDSITQSLARDRDQQLTLQRQLADAQSETAALGKPAPPAQAPGDGLSLQQQVATAQDRLNALRLRLKPEHPDVTKAERQLRELQDRATGERAKAARSEPGAVIETQEQRALRQRVADTRTEIESLDRQIAFKEAEAERQRKLLADYQQRIEQVPGVESEWIALTRDYETQKAEYNALLTKSGQSGVAVELERQQIGEQFKVLDQARLPFRPIGLPRFEINGIGAIAGIMLGVLFAAALELRDTTFTNGTEVLQVLQLPVLAIVPYIISDVDRRRTRRRRQLTASAAAAVVVAGIYGVWALELWKHVV